MPNYGFVIDLRTCIGCHACTIACKAEHDVPIGVNRCWVKTVERGTFPDTRRFFFPVLCNQCDAAPCVRICPTGALFKRDDGIVDLNGEACIGCRACMQACPYDQLFIDPATRTAEKCNFCANRIENQLQPACVSVCPTQCRVFGDLADPASHVSRLAQANPIAVRKPEKGTLPKILYIAADESVLRPEIAARPLVFKEGEVALRPLGAPVERPDAPGDPRVDYDVPHAKPWGLDLVAYLAAKGLATGTFLLSVALWSLGHRDALTAFVGPTLALLAVALTSIVLVADLERPERFHYILTRPNWRSWLVWGAWFLIAHGLLATCWLLAGLAGLDRPREWLVSPSVVASVLATSYTAFLFAQAHGRDLWQGPYAAVDLLAQSVAVGAASLLLASAAFPQMAAGETATLARILFAAVAAHLALVAMEYLLAPSPTRHHEMAVDLVVRGRLATMFWGGAVLAGALVPLACLLAARPDTDPSLVPLAATLAIAGAAAWDYVWIEAGQSVPLS